MTFLNIVCSEEGSDGRKATDSGITPRYHDFTLLSCRPSLRRLRGP